MPAPDYAVEIAQLRTGLSSGEARIESDGDVVIYRSVTDIQRALSYFERLAAMAGASAGRARSDTTFAAFEND